MIRVDDFGYDVDLHLNKEETGMVLEYAIDLMEGRDANNQAEESTIRATEILPEPFTSHHAVDPKDGRYFTGEEWVLIAKLTYLFRSTGVLPSLKTKAYTDLTAETRGIMLRTESDEICIELEQNCGCLHIMYEMLEAVALLS